jgi:hypothetical protein
MFQLKLKIFIKKFLYFFGVIKISIIKFDDSFCLSKIDNTKLTIVEGYPINKLINFFGQKLDRNTDPLLNILYSSGCILKKQQFVNLFKKNAKNIFNDKQIVSDVLQKHKIKKFTKFPWWSVTMPWEDILIKDNFEKYLKIFILNRKKLRKIYYKNYHLDKINLAQFVFNHDLSWEFHALKFYKLYRSISNYGFDKNSAIPVNIFIYKNNCRFGLSSDGNHRIRVAHILKFKTIPLKISKFINYNDIKKWKNVKNGTYSVTEAKKIFLDYYNYSNKNVFSSLSK